MIPQRLQSVSLTLECLRRIHAEGSPSRQDFIDDILSGDSHNCFTVDTVNYDESVYVWINDTTLVYAKQNEYHILP